MNAVTIGPTTRHLTGADLESLETYLTESERERRRPKRTKRDPETLLMPSDRADLVWFYNEHEAAVGLVSTWGEQLERWAGMRAADEQLKAEAEDKKQRMRAWVESGKHPNAYGSPKWDALTVDGKETLPGGRSSDFLAEMWPTKRARFIRARLVRAGRLAQCVLQTHCGPPSGEWPQPVCEDEQRERHDLKHAGNPHPPPFRFTRATSTRMSATSKFGSYLDLAVVVVRIHSWFEGVTTPATRIISARLSDQLFVHKTLKAATEMYESAATAYARAR